MRISAWARDPRAGLALLLLAALAFDVLRALTVPAGLWNIDEEYHFGDVQNAARLLPYEVGRRLGLNPPEPELLDAGTLPDPRALFRLSGGLPARGAAYHALQAVVQLPLAGAPEATRLLAARLVSVALHLLIIALAYASLRLLLPAGVLPWVPLAGATLAGFVPSYSDMLSGVNLDAAAAAAGAFFLWALLRILREGLGLKTGALLLLAAALGIGSKETFWPLLPAAPVALAWMLAGRRARLLGLAGAAALATGGLLWLQPLHEGGAAHWFKADWEFGHDAALAARSHGSAPVGEYALRVDREMSDGIWQFVPEGRLRAARGQRVTWGVWLRVSAPAEVPLGLHTGEGWLDARTARVGPLWTFYGGTATLAEAQAHLALRLGSTKSGAAIEYDGAALALGAFPPDTPPIFADGRGERGEWGGQPFTNLLLNPSAESAWPQVKDAYNIRPRNLNTRLNALLAWQRTLPAAGGLLRWLLANYWSGFGGLLPGLSARQMIAPALLSAWAAGGLAAIYLRDLPRRLGAGRERAARLGLGVLLAVFAAAWLSVLYRTDFVPSTPQVIVWAVARHASAGLTATAGLLALGLLRLLPARWHPWAAAGLALALLALNAWILLGVQVPYYACPSAPPTDCLPTVH